MLYIGVSLGDICGKTFADGWEGTDKKDCFKRVLAVFSTAGLVEQQPEDWYTQTMEGIRELLLDIDKSQVAGISFGGQMHGLVTLDEQDHVIRPAILSNDGRSFEETDYLNEVIGKEKLSEYTANIAFAGFTAPKILWMKKHEPENFRRIAKIMLPKDYLAYRLTGSFCTEVSDASGTLLLDVKKRQWSQQMLQICSVTEKMLPRVYESYEVVGTLRAETAKELGLSGAVKVIAGAGRSCLLLLSGQVLSEIADAIYLWERLGLFLCPAKALVLMSTMRSIRLDGRPLPISWAVC